VTRIEIPRAGSALRREIAAVALTAAIVFLLSPVRELSDSLYTLLVSHQLWTHGTLDLRPVVGRRPSLDRFPGPRQWGYPAQMRVWREGGPGPIRKQDRWHLYYFFPVGTPLLAVPVAALADLAGQPVVDPSLGGYVLRRERRLQGWAAALFAAIFVASAHAALRRALPRRPALAVTAALALATPVLSTASRALWSHTGCLLLAGLALPGIVRLARREARHEALEGLTIGALLAGAYVCRPTAAIMLAVVGGWLALRHRRAAFGCAAGAGAVLAGFLALTRATWGTWLPPYYEGGRIERLPSPTALAGVLFSPSRGLFVFVPVLAVLIAAGIARWRALEQRDLFAVGAAGLALQTLALASFPHWWGGYAYGPRLYTEATFFMVLLALPVVAHVRADAAPAGRRWRGALAVLAVAGVGLHAGALSIRASEWNSTPASIDEARERLWDWRDPQFLAWTRPRPPAAASAPSGDAQGQTQGEAPERQRQRQHRRPRR
jgi:hypothetical protein